MYTAKYCLKTKKTPEKEYHETHLEAKFKFKNEIAPKDKAVAHSVIDLISKGRYPEYFLIDVLDEVYNKGFLTKYFRILGTKSIIGIREHIFSLGFNIKVTAEGKVPLERMIDLDGLNNFVLNKK